MTLIAVELSDAGIMAAAGNPARLIPVDGHSLASPGYILPIKKKLSVGKTAECKAHLHPQQIQHRFWDQLSMIPLKPPEPWADNYAEMAHAHLAAIWRQIKPSGRSLVITLPGHFTREQMGLLLGIAHDLKIDVKGLINQAVAAAPYPIAVAHLLYVDIHLHRTEVSLLGQGDRLQHVETLTLDKGLIGVHRIWIDAISEAFVSATRYDPLHTADSEQALYDRLPETLRELTQNATTTVKTRADHTAHSISLSQDTLVGKAGAYYDQVCDLIRSLIEKSGQERAAATLLLSHRLEQLPGIETYLRNHLNVYTLVLAPGAAAKNVLEVWDQFERPSGDASAFFFKQRPWPQAAPLFQPQQTDGPDTIPNPTHLLYRNIAHPLTESPLAVIQYNTGEEINLEIVRRDQVHNEIICSVYLEGSKAVLSVEGTQKVYVDGHRTTGRMILTLGQTFYAADNDDPIRLIACL